MFFYQMVSLEQELWVVLIQHLQDHIHTELNPIVDIIYPKDDLPLLTYTDDDGLLVEPTYYVPIIPMVLINGMVGIGTGFSTNIPLYDPFKIINNIEAVDKDGPLPYLLMEPHYNKFKGQIVRRKTKFHFITKGLYQVFPNDNKVIITRFQLVNGQTIILNLFKNNIQSSMPTILLLNMKIIQLIQTLELFVK